MRIRVAVSASLVSLLVAAVAQAEGAASSNDAAYAKPTRRSDFTLGISSGFGFGRASGYPNEVQKIGDPAYESDTHLALGQSGLIWLGVAFNDYVTFGLGLGSVSLSGNGRTANAGVFGFHLDAYPLFDMGRNLQDLAVFGNVGTGPLTIKGGPEKAEGGLVSFVEAGFAYERLRLWRIGIGPTVSLAHLWSDSATLTGAVVGARVAFYSGP